LTPVSEQWKTLELDVEKAWKRKHTRTDLIDFLEVMILAISRADAAPDCLVDNVERK